MPESPVVIPLRPGQFGEAATVVASFAGMTATAFRYATGVAGLRIANRVGHVTLLPFQGQQVWDATFLGRPLAMGSMFDMPVATEDYHRTYGAFFLHCGATAMGAGPEDTHPPHGELPNARYQEAELVVGADDGGPFMELAGRFRFAVAFAHHYVAAPSVRLGAEATRIAVTMRVTNLKHAPMELMYLAHVNFRPVDGAKLLDTVPDDPRHMRVRAALPPGFVASPEYLALVEEMRTAPEAHRFIDPALRIDPELVFSMDCRADADGFAHAMQVHPDGSADFVSHRPDQLDHALRWIARNGDQEALGLMLPATAEADGYKAAKARGSLRLLPPGGTFSCTVTFGALARDEAGRMAEHIAAVRCTSPSPGEGGSAP